MVLGVYVFLRADEETEPAAEAACRRGACRVVSAPVRAAVLTISTSLARGDGEDQSGPALVELCEKAGLETMHEVVPDDREQIKLALMRHADEDDVRFVFTTGGTGMTIDDVTPEATRDVIDRDAPGYAETIRQESRSHTPLGILTRGVSGIRGAHADRQLPRLAEGDRAVVAGRRADAASTRPRRSSVTAARARRRRRAATASARRCRRHAHARARADARRLRAERRRQDHAAARARHAAAPARRQARVLGSALPDDAWKVRGRVGYLGHEPLLYRDLSVRENLRFHARLHGVGRERVDEAIAAVGLERRAGDALRELSRGMVQRAAVARAMLHDPPLLLLDEPRANLDPARGASARAADRPRERAHARGGRRTTSRATLAECDLALGLRGGRQAFAAAESTADQVGSCTRDLAWRSSARTSRSSCARAQSVAAMALFSVTVFVLFHFGLDRDEIDGDLASRRRCG